MYSSQNQQQINRDNKLISKSSVFKPKSATDNRDKADIKTIPQPQGDIRCKHKTNSDSSERQYIAKVRETVFTSHCTFEFETTRMGESLIDLVHQYPALRDKQNSKYKDSNFKDAKWREIAEMLGVPKDDAIKKWKSL